VGACGRFADEDDQKFGVSVSRSAEGGSCCGLRWDGVDLAEVVDPRGLYSLPLSICLYLVPLDLEANSYRPTISVAGFLPYRGLLPSSENISI
jgi:hypothetical protein